jgi:hypothetical protein
MRTNRQGAAKTRRLSTDSLWTDSLWTDSLWTDRESAAESARRRYGQGQTAGATRRLLVEILRPAATALLHYRGL